jgi:GMP synthase (glutamine-hydrolysing)
MDQEIESNGNRYCIYELIRPRVETMRVVLVDNLIKDETDFSEAAAREPDFNPGKWVRLERFIASLAMANIETNVRKLVRRPEIRTVHLSELNDQLVAEFDPDAIVLSGTLRDFDLYNPRLLENFNEFVRGTNVPVLAICGGHQLVGQAFGATIVTLDGKLPNQKRVGRLIEYQYRFVKITDPLDPIFAGIADRPDHRWQKYTQRRHLLRIWQNHGLQLDRLPDGFRQLARGYLTEHQMIVRRTPRQLIYGVQFHIEKSFQDWRQDKYWDHRNESRDGRLLFDNFLIEALRFRGKDDQLVTDLAVAPVETFPEQPEMATSGLSMAGLTGM